jgi:outer membrane protein assembly factor BamB
MSMKTLCSVSSLLATLPALAAGQSAISLLAPDTVTIDPGDLRAADRHIAWQVRLPLDVTERVQRAQLLDEHVYVTSDRGELYAIRAESGLVRWQRSVAEGGDFVFRLRHATATLAPKEGTQQQPEGAQSGGTNAPSAEQPTPAPPDKIIRAMPGEPSEDEPWGAVVVTEPGHVRFLRRSDGEELITHRLHVPPAGPMIADATQFYGVLANQRLAAFDRRDGIQRWDLYLHGTSASVPRFRGNQIFSGTDEGRVFLLKTKDRAKYWSGRVDGGVIEPAHVTQDDIILTTTEHYLYSIDPTVGAEHAAYRWRYRLNGRPYEGPTVIKDLILQYDPGDGLLAFNRANGDLLWASKPARYALADQGGAIAALDATKSRLYLLDAKTGKVRNMAHLGGVEKALRNTRTDAVYLVSRAGHVVCIRPRNAPRLELADLLPPEPPAESGAAPSGAQPAGNQSAAAAKGSALQPEFDPLRSDRRD